MDDHQERVADLMVTYLPMLMIAVFMSLFLHILLICHRLFQITLHKLILLQLMLFSQLLVKIQNF